MSLNSVFPSILRFNLLPNVLFEIITESRPGQSFKIKKKRRHNGILCKKLLHRGEKLAGKSKQLYSFKQIIKIVRFF